MAKAGSKAVSKLYSCELNKLVVNYDFHRRYGKLRRSEDPLVVVSLSKLDP